MVQSKLLRYKKVIIPVVLVFFVAVIMMIFFPDSRPWNWFSSSSSSSAVDGNNECTTNSECTNISYECSNRVCVNGNCEDVNINHGEPCNYDSEGVCATPGLSGTTAGGSSESPTTSLECIKRCDIVGDNGILEYNDWVSNSNFNEYWTTPISEMFGTTEGGQDLLKRWVMEQLGEEGNPAARTAVMAGSRIVDPDSDCTSLSFQATSTATLYDALETPTVTEIVCVSDGSDGNPSCDTFSAAECGAGRDDCTTSPAAVPLPDEPSFLRTLPDQAEMNPCNLFAKGGNFCVQPTEAVAGQPPYSCSIGSRCYDSASLDAARTSGGSGYT